MRSPLLAACAGSLVLGGCQLVLPIHEVPDAGDSSPPSDGGGASDSSSVAPDSSSATDAGAQDAKGCDMAFGGLPACDECINEECCPEITQCFSADADVECAAIEMCIEMCALGDFACPMQCVNAHPTGKNDYASFVQCAESKACAGACGDAG